MSLSVALGVALAASLSLNLALARRSARLARLSRDLASDDLEARLEVAAELGHPLAPRLLAEARRTGPRLKRPLLEGEALAEYRADFDSAQTSYERGEVTQRWHARGFRFPAELRRSLLRSCPTAKGRDVYRGWFVEQDELVETSRAARGEG